MLIRSFPALVEELDEQDESTHNNMGETDEEVQDTCIAFDRDLDLHGNGSSSQSLSFYLCFKYSV
jgi:hypothetical protein